jgi:hypothetical protein
MSGGSSSPSASAGEWTSPSTNPAGEIGASFDCHSVAEAFDGSPRFHCKAPNQTFGSNARAAPMSRDIT